MTRVFSILGSGLRRLSVVDLPSRSSWYSHENLFQSFFKLSSLKCLWWTGAEPSFCVTAEEANHSVLHCDRIQSTEEGIFALRRVDVNQATSYHWEEWRKINSSIHFPLKRRMWRLLQIELCVCFSTNSGTGETCSPWRMCCGKVSSWGCRE